MSKVSLVQCSDYSNVKRAIETAVNHLGGMGAYVKKGQKVLLKPNLLSAKTRESAVCTDPSVILAVAELCKQAGAGHVMIGDSPGRGTARGALVKLGVADELEKRGFEIIEFRTPKEIKQPNRRLSVLSLSKEVFDADVVINLPKIKTHALMVLTAATKNMFGTVVGMAKPNWHLKTGRDVDFFATVLLEIAKAVNPVLTIVDGVVGMDGNGPGAGRARPVGCILAGSDVVAIDRVICEIVDVAANSVHVLNQARQKNDYGETDLKKIQLLGDDLAKLRISDWKLPPRSPVRMLAATFAMSALNDALNSKPAVVSDKCTACRICIEHCPAEAMTLNKTTVIDYDKCIRCYCCQELCPEGAIILKQGWLGRCLRRISK